MASDTTIIAEAGENAEPPDSSSKTLDAEVLKLGSLVKQARSGDQRAGSLLKEMGITVETAQGPHFNTAIYIQEKLLSEIGKEDREYAQGIRRTVTQMRSDLCRADSSPEEQLLAQVIISDWLFFTHLTERYGLGSGAISAKEDELWRKRINQAHQRLLRSIRTRAQVKKLLLQHTVQLNIADKQVVQNTGV